MDSTSGAPRGARRRTLFLFLGVATFVLVVFLVQLVVSLHNDVSGLREVLATKDDLTNLAMIIGPTDPVAATLSGACGECHDPAMFAVAHGEGEVVRELCTLESTEMEALIERTAMSPFIREKKDFYAALFDEGGRLIAGSNLPIFGDVVGPVAEHYPLSTMRPGDIYWFNDCYASRGAVSHSPDQVLLAPVFADGVLSGFAQSWAHFNDIGGMRPGSLSPDCTEILKVWFRR